ncbi:MAG: ComEC/Rec2 family competence protein [Porcipelethomonas sp.]
MAKRKKTAEKRSAGKFLYLVLLIAAVVTAAHFTGIFTFNDWKDVIGIFTDNTAEGAVQVHYIDVGQGDCELIVSDGHAVMIDTGEREEGENVCTYLESAGVKKLDCLILTHPHSDHMGAASYIVDNTEIEKIVMPKLPDDMTPSTKVYEDFLESVQKKGLKLTAAEPGLKIEIGQAVLEIISPVSDEYSNLNDFSSAAILRHGDNKFLFTGDNGKAAEKDIIDSVRLESADVLKVGHHGSSSSSCREFLETVKPEYAVISCGEGNSYGHPNEDAVERIKEYTDKIYRTDIDGTIVITSDEDGIKVETEN